MRGTLLVHTRACSRLAIRHLLAVQKTLYLLFTACFQPSWCSTRTFIPLNLPTPRTWIKMHTTTATMATQSLLLLPQSTQLQFARGPQTQMAAGILSNSTTMHPHIDLAEARIHSPAQMPRGQLLATDPQAPWGRVTMSTLSDTFTQGA